MVSAVLAPVATPTNTRAAPSQAVAGDADPADKGFASALDLAQAPARVKHGVATKGGAKAEADAKAHAKDGSRAEPPAEATSDPSPATGNTPEAQQAGEPDGRTDEPSPVDSAGLSDLAQLLPGWPASPTTAPQGPIAATPQSPIAATPQSPVAAKPQSPVAAVAPGPVATAGAASAAGASADANDALAVRAGLAEPLRRDSATTRTPLPMPVPLRDTAQAAQPGPTLAHQLAPAAAPGNHRAPKATGLAMAGAEAPTAVPARGGTDNALAAGLPLPALAAPTAPAAAPALTPPPPLFEARIAAAVESSAFAPALASQITWLVREGLQQARFSLNPQEMGPLAVTIMLDGTQARIDFSADMAGTRAAIEASLPTLAAALHDNGLTLAGGGVFDRQSRAGGQGEHGHRAPSQHGGANASAPAPAGDPDAATPLRATRGLVDLVA